MTTGQRMRERRKELGLSAEYVADRLGVSPATIYRYEKGDIEKMPGNILEPVAQILRTTPAYLMGWKESSSVDKPSVSSLREIDELFDSLNEEGQEELCSYGRYLTTVERYKPSEPRPARKAPARIIPLLGASFAAGAPEAPGDLMFSDYETEDPRAEFAIRVNGNSMEPALPDGSIALGVKRLPRDGEVGAFFLDGGFLVKQFCSDGKNVYLLSINRHRSDADETVWASSDRDLRVVGTILLDKQYPLP